MNKPVQEGAGKAPGEAPATATAASNKLTDKPLEKGKVEIKDINDHKLQHDGKNTIDHKLFKDHRDSKLHKEIKDKEFQFEGKHVKWEFEKPPITEGVPKGLVPDTGPLHPPVGDPAQPGALEQRMAQLESVVASLSTFISPALRPDLGAGALTNEKEGGQG